MVLPLYLALTPWEMAGNSISQPAAYMSCHFSPGGPGLSNLPDSLPPGSMLILDDSTPMQSHDPDTIVRQLASQADRWQCGCVLLDFQRPGNEAQQKLAEEMIRSLPCPVGVSHYYAEHLSCPVFLPPLPPDKPLSAYLAPWQGREIWLEAALNGLTLTLTETGCTASPLPDFPEQGQENSALHCHYSIEAPATFRMWRTREDLDGLLAEAEKMGVAKAVGLWQELAR